jgi:hypothetical protein
MTNDDLCSALVPEYLHASINGENLLFIGPNRALIKETLTAIRAELSLRTRVAMLGSAEESAATHLVAHNLTPEQALRVLLEQPDKLLLASLTSAHLLGAKVGFARELQRLFGERSRLSGAILEESLRCIRSLCVPIASEQPKAQGAFRENLLRVRYNQGKLGADNGQLLKGWARDHDACDPGWELDK